MATQSVTSYNTAKYNPRYSITYNNPNKLPTTETVSKIFLSSANGNYFDIKKAIMKEHASLSLQDSQNRTIIHYILLSGKDLTKNDKYELIKSAIDSGAPVDLPDANGVRPLHLAAVQQNRKVINLLIQKKAEINSRDNNFMTPLHYAVVPETVTCK